MASSGPTKTQNISLLKNSKKNRSETVSPPRLLVLVGIPGSGKSTFASFMSSIDFEVICQDDLGDRRACERRAVESFLQGRNVVIDRCNFNETQRKHWVDYGLACGAEIGVIVFGIPLQECINRVSQRQGHPTLGPGGAGDHVVRKMASEFVFPKKEEGFEFCRVIRNQEDAQRVYDEISKWAGKG